MNKQQIRQSGDKITYSKRCSVTGELYQLTVPIEKFHRWQSGELIQKVFPMLSADQREFIVTGITPAEWEEMFKE